MVTCSGSGPAADLARRAAVQACNGMAVEYLGGTFRVQSITVETEGGSSFHSESSSKLVASGLSCDPIREEAKEDQGEHRAFLECRYAAKQAKVLDAGGPDEPTPADDAPIARVLKETPILSGPAIEEKPIVQSESKSLLLTVIPSCHSILIRGKFPRIVGCGESSPISVLIRPTDKELVVRGPKGFLPKHVSLKPRRGLATAEELTLQINLERR